MASKKDRFEILLEEMRSNSKAIAEGHGILVNKIEGVQNELRETKKELNEKIIWSNRALHEKIDGVETKLTNEINKVKAEVAEVKAEVAEVKAEFRQEINDVKKGITKIDTKLTHVLDRQDIQEAKIEKVYQKVFIKN